MPLSNITINSGYYQAVSGLSLNREGISIPLGFGSDWSKIGIGITANLNTDLSSITAATACGNQPDRRFWIGVKTNPGFPQAGYVGDGDFVGYSSFAFTGDPGTNADGQLYSQVNVSAFLTGSEILGYSLISNFYGSTLVGGIPAITNIPMPLFSTSRNQASLYPTTTGDYVNFILMITKVLNPDAGAPGQFVQGFTGEFLRDFKSSSLTGQVPAFLTKTPDLRGLDITMNAFYQLNYSGNGQTLSSASIANFSQNTVFIYSPYTGWQITDILIKRFS